MVNKQLWLTYAYSDSSAVTISQFLAKTQDINALPARHNSTLKTNLFRNICSVINRVEADHYLTAVFSKLINFRPILEDASPKYFPSAFTTRSLPFDLAS